MSSPAVDSYLDELLAELPAADGAQAAASASLPAVTPAPGPAPASAPPPPGAHAVVEASPPVPAAMPAAVPAVMPVAAPAEAPAAVAGPRTVAPRSSAPATLRPVPATQRWLRVALGRDHYAFELLRVQEVVRLAPIVAVRGADRAVLGVMNLRGRIVPVFDLGRWLGGADVTVDERARIVVVERDDELIGVLVADVEDVASLGREHIEPPLPGSACGSMNDVIVGVARVGRVPTVLLDANALFG